MLNRLRALAPKAPPPALRVLLLLVFLKQIGNGMVWSVIALYGQELGASAAVIGLMISAYGGARLMVNMPAGYASERLGRKTMMSLGCAIIAASSLAAAYASNVPFFFLCLLLMGAASAVFMTSALAAIADLGAPEQRMQDASYYQAANMIGASMGPALGGMAAGLWGMGAPYFINGLVAIAGVFAFAAIPWRPANKPAKEHNAPKESLRVIARRNIGVGLMYFAIFYVRVASNWVLLPLVAQNAFGLEMTKIGVILTCGAIANLCVLAVTAPLVRLLGRVRMIVAASLATLVGCLLLAFGEHEAFLWLSSILFGAGAGIASPTLIAYVAEIAPADQRGPAMGLLRTMQDLSLILGPAVTGLISDNLSLGHLGGLLGCAALLAATTVYFRATARAL